MLNPANLIKIIRLINYIINFAETLFMHNRSLYIIVLFFCLFVTDLPLFGQEVLRSSKIQAKANRKHLPALGLPERANGELDPVVWYKDGNWRGADSLKADPFWMTETIDVDTVIMSIGTSPNPLIKSTTEGLQTTPKGGIVVDEDGLTSREGVYAGGDAVTGAATVILAMEAGKAGAKGIHEYLSNK